MVDIPESYIGREQAYLKHSILEHYLQRLFMIVGRGKVSTINYVDCFAGPWQGGDEQLSDTSIGVSLKQIDSCRQGLQKRPGREVKFRALYIEKDPEAYQRLQAFLSSQSYADIEVECLKGDYTELLNEIVEWCGGQFTFFFVDPQGWKKVITSETLRPLLQMEQAEFLINLMYDFLNRAVSIERHQQDILEIFGEIPALSDLTPEDRQTIQVELYRRNINNLYGGRTAAVPVERPDRERVLYYLIYLTRNDVGLKTFMEEAEKMEVLQRRVRFGAQLRKQTENSPTVDLFADQEPENESVALKPVGQSSARDYLLQKLSRQGQAIDNKLWADFLEESNFYPSELQSAMRELVKGGLVENMDAPVKQRTKKVIRPDYFDKSERWRVV